MDIDSTGGSTMHSVLITFTCAASPDDLEKPFREYAIALRDQPGFLSKTWIRTDIGYGGFHLFADRASADAYLRGELAAGLMATDGFDDFVVTHYDVFDELSAMTGVQPAAAR
ncbi:MAG: YdhR family protein [Actinomycetota bacterium]